MGLLVRRDGAEPVRRSACPAQCSAGRHSRAPARGLSGFEASLRMPLRSRAPGSAALQKRLSAANPSRHPEAAEPCQRRIEERPRALGVTRLAAARVHERLVEIYDCAQRAGTLLVENRAGLREPVDGLVVALLESAKPCHGEATVHHGIAEVGGYHLLAQIALDDLDVILTFDEPERRGRIADDANV